MNPLVTIGVPTYNRPELLARALASVARQGYRDLEVIVADNASPGAVTSQVVESHRSDIPGLHYHRHATNIGPLANFMFLLGSANGRFFMWLADDDEISDNYVASLVALLESNPDSSSAAGHWMLMDSAESGRLMPTSSYLQRSPLLRAVRFVWRSDDAFFYGLHRTDVLRTADFAGYARPNRAVLQNWAYVYLLDVVLQGRVLKPLDTSVMFINHDYTPKNYEPPGRSPRRVAASGLRRINVHYLYWKKCARHLSIFGVAVVMVTSILSLTREGGTTLLREARRFAMHALR